MRISLKKTALGFLVASAFLLIFQGNAGAAPEHITVLLDMLPLRFPADPFLENGTTMVPLRALSEALGFNIGWDGEKGEVSCTKDDLQIMFRLSQNKVLFNGTEIALDVPPHLYGDHTVIPLRFFSESLGYRVSWDGETKTATVHSGLQKQDIFGFYALGNAQYSSWQDTFGDKYPYVKKEAPPAKNMEGAFLGWFGVDDKGQVVDEGHDSGFMKPDGWPAVLLQLKTQGAEAYAMVFSENKNNKLSDLLDDKERRDQLAAAISLATLQYDGILIDFEGLGGYQSYIEKDRDNFNSFMDTLRQKCKDRFLGVALPPLNGHFLGYDHGYLGEIVDRIVLMAYGFEDPYTPGSTAPWAKVDEAIRLELDLVPRSKLILGIPSYGTSYRYEGTSWSLIGRPAAKDFSPKGEVSFVPAQSCNVSGWSEEGSEYRVYFETPQSMSARANLAKRYNLSGIAVWRLGILPQGFWDALLEVVEPSP